MNKNDLVTAIAKESKLSKKDSEVALNAFMSVIGNAMKKKDKVTLAGFGTWEVRERKERMGVNPRTRQKIKIPASKVPAFKAGKALKELTSGVKPTKKTKK
jgi:DNA-binding protein HU-beta